MPKILLASGWRYQRETPSLAEIFRTIPVSGRGIRRALSFFGPGYLIAVGYMDPGNWATDLYGGSAFGYMLLSVILLSNLMAMLLQHLAIRLGVATNRDLAQACRDHFPRPVAISLWILCEIAICACDLAELIGTAIALHLLFGISLVTGVLLTGIDVLLILLLARWGFRVIEMFVIVLLVSISTAFITEMVLVSPNWGDVASGFVPRSDILTNPLILYVAIGIMGATVMPHNLYLHSSIVQARAFTETCEGRREAIKFATIDSMIALSLALLINAAILILAAGTFHGTGQVVIEIQEAYQLLSPALGSSLAATAFALALLASGQNSAITATLAGQVVMEGFLSIRLPPLLRRALTRGLAMIPAVIVAVGYGSDATAKLLVFSQVILSVQLPFAVIPLVMFTSDRAKMGDLVAPPWLRIASITICCFIVIVNLKLIVDFLTGI